MVNKICILISVLLLLILFTGCEEKSELTPESRDFGEDISRIRIRYHEYDSAVSESFFYEINRVGGEFVIKDGKVINSEKINNLADSLVNLYKSGGLKTCRHTSGQNIYKVEILYSDGERTRLTSDSDCYKNIPWNVVTKDKLFIQYSGEISDALFQILDKEPSEETTFAPINMIGVIPNKFNYGYEGFLEFPVLGWRAMGHLLYGYPTGKTPDKKLVYIKLSNELPFDIKITDVVIKVDDTIHKCILTHTDGDSNSFFRTNSKLKTDSVKAYEPFWLECFLEKLDFPMPFTPLKADLYIKYEDEKGVSYKTDGSIEGVWTIDHSLLDFGKPGDSYTPTQIIFSEKELYLNILNESRLFEPFLSDYEIKDLEIYCRLNEIPDCSEIEGFITIQSREGKPIEIPLKFKNQKLIEMKLEEKVEFSGKFCKTHSDCKGTCGCGCININEDCESTVLCEIGPADCICLDNVCTEYAPYRWEDWTFEDCENKLPEGKVPNCQSIIARFVAKQDLEKAIRKCATLEEVAAYSCYRNLIESVTEEDLARIEKLCDELGSSLCYERLVERILPIEGVDRAEELCDKAGTNSCYEDLVRAIAVENIDRAEELCDKIRTESCYTLIAYQVKGDEDKFEKAMSICDKIEEGLFKDSQYSRDRCYFELNRGGSLLNFKSEEEAMDFCRKKIKIEGVKSACFMNIAKRSTNPLVCEEIAAGFNKDTCVNYIKNNQRAQNL